MIPMKEDGRLDVAFIEKLPHNEFEELISQFTPKQLEYYEENAHTEKGPTKAIKVDYSLEDFDDWGWGIDMDKLLDRMRKKYKIE